jgi:aminomethyltransferase
MRRSPIRDLLIARGASFSDRAGVEVVSGFSSFEEEYGAVRRGVGLTDFSHATRFKIPEAGLDMLERYATGPVANIRFGRVLHTMAANPEGFVESDLYVANDDEMFFVIGESLIDDASTVGVFEELKGFEVGLEDISGSTALFGLDGLNAWAVAKDMFGADVLGLPYLSLEVYDLDGVEIKLIRAGKTSEFGYLLLVPAEAAAVVWEKIEKAGEPHGLRHVGLDAHMALRLDGRFFNIYFEGARVRDPLALGLQWMIDFERDEFRGCEAILERRRAGLKKKIIGVVPEVKDASLKEGDRILHGDKVVAEVVCAVDSPTLEGSIGLALFDWEYAFSGLPFDSSEGMPIRTVSLPPFTAKSRGVELDEM